MISTSVIVPVFQDPEGLKACLHGLARQSIPQGQFEVIVVDNGSSPPITVPASIGRNLSIVRCEKPGSYAARNVGAQAARGTFLAFTDADCVPDAYWLANGIGALAMAGRHVIAGGHVRFTLPPKPTMVSLYQVAVGFQQAENIERKGFSATANLFCSRQAFERIGPFAEKLLSGGDREWAWRARRIGIETIFVPDAIVETPPRSTFIGAARQARRVAAGRYQLRQSGLAADRLESLQPHRGIFASLLWISSRHELRLPDRLRVLVAAGLLKGVSVLESMRVRLGGQAERR